MQNLNNHDAREAMKYFELQKKFLEEHLNKWVPAFSEDIFRNTEKDFYKGAGLLLRVFISSETEHIAEVIETLKSQSRFHRLQKFENKDIENC